MVVGCFDHVVGPVGAPDDPLWGEGSHVARHGGDVGIVRAAGAGRLIAARKLEQAATTRDQGLDRLDIAGAGPGVEPCRDGR
jgi:hypothetical protein